MIYIGIGLGFASGWFAHWIVSKYTIKKVSHEQIVIDIKVNSEEALKQLDEINRQVIETQKILKRK